MKIENSTTTGSTRDKAQRVAVAASPSPVASTASASEASTDTASLEAEIQQLAREEEALRERRDARRQEYWTRSLANLTKSVEALVAFGYDRAEIGKHLGFGGAKASSAKKAPAAGGPKTHDGWYALYFKNGIQLYYRAHPDSLATLKASGIKPDQYPGHIPAADLKQIETTARAKAQAKCPATSTADPEVVSK